MHASSHAILSQIDAARAAEHAQALAAWRSGPHAEWVKACEEARRTNQTAPEPPPAPKEPASLQHAVINVASLFGVAVDDLVRRARRTEVRAVYPSGVLDAAVDGLGEETVALLSSVAWPELPPLPAAPAPPAEAEPTTSRLGSGEPPQ